MSIWIVIVGGVLLICLLLVAAETVWRATGIDPEQDPEGLARFRALTLNEVRARAESFERDASQKPDEWMYLVPARSWRRLEATMRQEGAFEVADLGVRKSRRWARKLHVLHDR